MTNLRLASLFVSAVDAKKWLKWALRFAAAILLTPWVEFDIKVMPEDFAQRVADLIKDGKLSDEDLAEMLNRIADML
jgi:hypothetical protein